MSDETPTFEKVVKDMIEARLLDLHVMLPGEILKYNSATQYAEVRPCLKRRKVDGTIVDMPVIVSVPVHHPRTAGSSIHLPVKAGDKCSLIFAERSLDLWKVLGGCQDPKDPRKHNLSDCVAYPGMYDKVTPFVVADPDSLEITNGTSRITVLPSGKFKIAKIGGDELIDLTEQLANQASLLANEVTQITVNTIFGVSPINNIATFVARKAAIDTLKAKITAIKG